MKLIKLLLPLTLLLFVACDDNHEHIHQETKEEMIQEFIEHAEEDHFEVPALQDTVSVVGSPAINKENFVYSIAFDGASSGKVKFTFTDEPHDRTIFTNTPVTITVQDATGQDVMSEETVDVSNFTAAIIKQMVVYELEPNSEYSISFTDVTVDTVKVLVAPRGIDGEHDHD